MGGLCVHALSAATSSWVARVVDLARRLEGAQAGGRGEGDGQDMACPTVYGIEWEDVLDNCQLVHVSYLPSSSPLYRRVHIWLWTSDGPFQLH